MSSKGTSGVTVATTTAAGGCGALLFMVVLSIMAFVTRDNGGPVHPDDAPARVAPRPTPVATPAAPALDDATIVSAALSLEPALVGCFREAHQRDPSAGRRATVEVQVRVAGQGPELVGARVKAAPSPFFRPCMERKVEVRGSQQAQTALLIVDWDGQGVHLSVQRP